MWAVWTAVVLGLWAGGSAYLVPSPAEVVFALVRLITQDGLFFELWVSLRTNLEAIAISTVLSLAISYLSVTEGMRPLSFMVGKARFFGLAGFTIIFTMIFGGGHALKVSLLVFMMTVSFVTSMSAVVQSAQRSEYDQARSLRMGQWRMVWEVAVLGRIDQAFDLVAWNAAIGWMMLAMVEGLVRSEGGVGAMVLNQSKYFHLDAVFAITLSVGVVGVVQDQLLAWLKGVVCPYSKLKLEAR